MVTATTIQDVFDECRTEFSGSTVNVQFRGEEATGILVDVGEEQRQTDAGTTEGLKGTLYLSRIELTANLSDGDIVKIWSTETEGWVNYRVGNLRRRGGRLFSVELKAEFDE